MNKTYLLLGSNAGDRETYINTAIEQLGANKGIVVNKSSFYETAAWGKEDQPDFLNLVICLETQESAAELLSGIQEIEKNAGRQRTEKWGQRTLDIDILFFNSEVINLSDLTIPHPSIHLRRFTLAPMVEVAPQFIHPLFHKTMTQLLAECPDQLEVRKIN